MSSPTVSPLDERSRESNAAKSETSEESESSYTEESSETEDELQDDRNTDLRGPVNASVASSNADAEKGSKNETDGFPPQMLETLEDLSNDQTPTPISEPKESAELQANINSGNFRGKKDPTL